MTCWSRCRASRSSRRPEELERGLGQATENVLINGQRIANKSGGAVDQLKRTSAANVERIEIVDAASLGIAGLAGQVANVVLKTEGKASGQFEWDPSFRAHYAKPEFLRGSISYSGKNGPIDYTFSARNEPGRGGLGGPVVISDRNGVVTERRHEVYHCEYEEANLQAKFGIDGPGSSVGNLTLGYTPYWNPEHIRDRRDFVGGEVRSRTNVTKLAGYKGDINGDYEFAARPRAAEADRRPSLGPRAARHHPDPAFRQQRRRRSGHALQPRHPHWRNHRPRRISLEERRQRLAVVVRARVQFARPEGPLVRSQCRRRVHRAAVSRRDRQGRRNAL